MIDLSYYIKVSSSPSGCNSYDAEQFKCDRYLDCESCLEDKIIEHDKHIIEQYNENTKLKDTIKDIHDNVAHEMYFKAIDDFVKLAKDHDFKYGKKDISDWVIGFIEFFAEQLKQSQSHSYYSYVEMLQQNKKGDKKK